MESTVGKVPAQPLIVGDKVMCLWSHSEAIHTHGELG